MADSRTRTASMVFVAFGLVLIAAAQGCSSAAPEVSTNGSGPAEFVASAKIPNWIICGTYQTVGDDGMPEEAPEYYILRAMNRKLQYFPEFAAAMGMKSVSTCDEARAFSRAYQAYFRAHPYFDRDIPMDPAEKIPNGAAETAGAVVPKIFNGVPAGPASGDANLFPVVHIQTFMTAAEAVFFNGPKIPQCQPNGCAIACSGTFIARNWILTAAHCFDRIALSLDPNTDQGWLTNWRNGWTIDWPDSNGNISIAAGGTLQVPLRSSTFKAWTMANPNYVGLCGTGANCASLPSPPNNWDPTQKAASGQGYDIGLLWIPSPGEDGHLAASIDSSAWPVQNQTITNSLLGTWVLGMYGYGPTQNTLGGTIGLTFGTPEQMPGVFTLPGGAINVILSSTIPTPPSAGFSSLCQGDSGGPLVRTTTATDANGNPFQQTVIVGVNQKAFTATTPCAFSAGDDIQWSRVDVVKDWLLGSMRDKQNGAAFAPQLVADGNIAGSYEKLWGTPCKSDCDCAAIEHCEMNWNLAPAASQNPPTAPRTDVAAFCDQCGADCSCMVGQCLPLPADSLTKNLGVQTCSGTCTDTKADSNNCGACGNACVSGQSCVAGVCQ